MQNFILNNGISIPQIGFGTWLAAEGHEAVNSVTNAIKCGYRHIDTAAIYGNELSVGEAIRTCELPREELFLTSKVWNSHRGEAKVLEAFDTTMDKLNVDYLDLYLVHWPANATHNPYDWAQINSSTWAGMEKILKSGRVRAIGVSNFMPEHLKALLQTATVIPAVNQLEFHPGYMQVDAVKASKKEGISVQAWSPIGRGALLQDELLLQMAAKYGKSAAQICIRWCMQHNTIVLPKSVNAQRMKENIQSDEFTISDEDMKLIDAMPTAGFSGFSPYTANF